MRVLIVDDEPLARRGVRVCLAGASEVEIVGECADGKSAVEHLARLAPDLVFLDVQMPGIDGFGVLARVPPERWPLVIFLTAHEQHALRAFNAHALDYLLKPIDDDRFALAMDRARQRLRECRAGEMLARMDALLREYGSQPAPALPAVRADYLERFAVKNGTRTVLVPVEEVSWISAEGDYAGLHVAGGRVHLVRTSLNELEQRLDPAKFARVHRSAIVSKAQVREVQALSSRDYQLRLADGGELRMSRNYRDRLAPET
jgi:two-component system LytT family response regulator